MGQSLDSRFPSPIISKRLLHILDHHKLKDWNEGTGDSWLNTPNSSIVSFHVPFLTDQLRSFRYHGNHRLVPFGTKSQIRQIKFRAVSNQANQQHVQNGALRLRGIWIPKKKQTQPWTTHSVQVYLLHMFSWGPESITCVSFKNKIFLRMGSWFYKVGFLISWKLYRIKTPMNHHNHQQDYRILMYHDVSICILQILVIYCNDNHW